ncbi:MAG: hypothetical protein WCY88_13915 [Spongiibacteraceae bacterium]
MIIKPQDTLIALKYCSIELQAKVGRRETGLPPEFAIRDLAEVIGISHGEISRANQRLEKAQLLSVRGSVSAVARNLVEWLSYGIRYYCPLERSGYGRGVGTGWNCNLIKSDMNPPQPGWAWASSQGDREAELIVPFHNSVPLAASNDPWLYQALSLVEVIRGGKPRELAIARDLLAKHLGVMQ